jgi:hypothetical protein
LLAYYLGVLLTTLAINTRKNMSEMQMDRQKVLKQIDELLADPWKVDIKELFDAFVDEPDEIKQNLYNALYTYVLQKRQMDVINEDKFTI